MSTGAVHHVKPERLRFVGQWDCEATLSALHRDPGAATYADLARYMRIERTLATGKEQVCQVK